MVMDFFLGTQLRMLLLRRREQQIPLLLIFHLKFLALQAQDRLEHSPITSSLGMTLGMSLSLSKPQFLHL